MRHNIIYLFMSLVAILACGFALVLGSGLEALAEAVAAIGYGAMAAGAGKVGGTPHPPIRPTRHAKRRRRIL